LVLFSFFSYLLVGCLGDRCGPGEVLEEGQCRSTRSAPDDGAVDDGAVDDDGGGMGDVCTEAGINDQCKGEADLCIVMPGQTQGYCTTQGCTAEPNDCPAPYTCMDLSTFEPSLTTACVQM
jgi:hypothetical protein